MQSIRVIGAPKVLACEQGKYVVVQVDAQPTQWEELIAFGRSYAEQYNVQSPQVDVKELDSRGHRYLIIVNQKDR